MKKNNKFILGAVIPLFWFSLYTYSAYLTEYITSLGESMAFAGMVSGAYGLVQTLLRIPAGLISDFIGKRKPFVTIGCLLSTSSALGLLFSKSPEALLVFRGLAGAAAACWVQISVMYSSYFDKSEATRAVGSALSLNNSGQLLGVLAGTVATIFLSIRYTFLIAVAGGVAGILLSLFTAENRFEKDKSGLWANLVSDKPALARLITVSLFAVLAQVMLFGGPSGFAPKLAKDFFGATKFEMGLLTVLSSLAIVLCSRLLSIRLQKRLGYKGTLFAGFLCCTVYFLSVPLLKSLQALFAMQALYGVGQGTLFPVLMGLSIKNVSETKRASFMGVFQSVYGIGMFIGPWLVGELGDRFGLVNGFFTIGFIGLFAAFYALCVRFERHT